MAGDEDQAEKIVTETLLAGGVEVGFETGHGGFLLGFEFAAKLLMLAFEKFDAAKMIDSAVFGGGHEPRTGIVRYAGLRPFFEGGDQRVLREFFGEADVARHTSEHRDNLGGLHAPDGVNGAVRGGDFGRNGHGDPFTRVKESAYEKR